MLSRKLRIYAILMRLHELELERIEEIRQRRIMQFRNPPISLTAIISPLPPEFTSLYDKNGKLFELPKSKFHK
jgi:hypothetical protein